MKLFLRVAGIVAGFMAFAYLAIVDAEEPERHRIVVGGVSSDGVTVPATQTATTTPAPSSEATAVFETTPIPIYWFPEPVERWRNLVASVFQPWNVDYVLAIIQCESYGNPDATGAAGERGLLQIHPIHGSLSTYDPAGNIAAAWIISNYGTDFSPWSCG